MHTGKTTIKEATVTMVLIWIVAEVEVHTVEVDEDTEDVVEVVVAWEEGRVILGYHNYGLRGYVARNCRRPRSGTYQNNNASDDAGFP